VKVREGCTLFCPLCFKIVQQFRAEAVRVLAPSHRVLEDFGHGETVQQGVRGGVAIAAPLESGGVVLEKF